MKLFNIHDTESFYDTIDTCEAPVLVTASDGSTEDFRNNILLREVLENANHGTIPEIELHTESAADTRRLLNFMVYGYTWPLEAEKKSA